MKSKSTISVILFIILFLIPFSINTSAQRNPTKKGDDRIEKRFPGNDQKPPNRSGSQDLQRHKQTEYPKYKNPPQQNENVGIPIHNPQPDYEPPVETVIVETVIIEHFPPVEPEFIIPDYRVEGIQNYKDGNYKDAIEYLTTAIEADTNDFELYYYRGLSELKIHFYIEAVDDFSKYIDFFFYEPDGFFQRGLAKFYLFEKEKAKEDFEIAAEMGHKQAISILKRFY